MAKAFHGRIEDTLDALIILEACRQGVLPKINRRLLAAERGEVQDNTIVKSEDGSPTPPKFAAVNPPMISTSLFPGESQLSAHIAPPNDVVDLPNPSLITPGSVFVFDEEESKICRWTDGRIWSPSRICGNFLVYRELFRKLSNEKCLTPKEKAKMKNGSGLKDKALKERVEKDNLVVMGCMKGTFVLKKDGLIKKTICVKGINLPSPQELSTRAYRGRGRMNKRKSDAPPPGFSEAGIQHLVCYEKPGAMENLHRPREYVELLNLPLSRTFIMMQKYRNPIRILRLAPEARSIEPFDEYVSSDRVVEGRASEDDASSEKDSKPKTKRKKAGRCREKDNDEGFMNTTSGSSGDEFIELSGNSSKRTRSTIDLNHSYSTRGQHRQIRNAGQHRIQRQRFVTPPTSRRKRLLSEGAASTRDVLSKKNFMQGECVENQPSDRFQDFSLMDGKRDGGTEDRTTHHHGNPIMHPNPHQLNYDHLAVHGVKTMDGQWCLLPATASIQFGASRYHSPHYNIWHLSPETSYDHAGQIGQRVDDRTRSEPGGPPFEQQGTVQDDALPTQQGQVGQVAMLKRAEPAAFSHKEIDWNEPQDEEAIHEPSSSPLSNSIMTNWSSSSLSSRDSLSSSYSLSPAAAAEDPCENDLRYVGEPQSSPEARRDRENVPRLENWEESHCISPAGALRQYASSSIYRSTSPSALTSPSHKTRVVDQDHGFQPGETSSPTNTYETQQFTPIASRCHGPRTRQLPPIFTSRFSGEQCGSLPHLFSVSGTNLGLSRQPEINRPNPASSQDGSLHDKARPILNTTTVDPVLQEAFCTGAAKSEVIPEERWSHIYKSMAQYARATQIGDQDTTLSFVDSPQILSQCFQVQGPIQDSCTSSFSLVNPFPRNLEGRRGQIAFKPSLALPADLQGECSLDDQHTSLHCPWLMISQHTVIKEVDTQEHGHDMPETHLGNDPVGYKAPELNRSFEPLHTPIPHAISYDTWSPQRQKSLDGNQGPTSPGMENTLNDDGVQYCSRKRQKTRVEQQDQDNIPVLLQASSSKLTTFQGETHVVRVPESPPVRPLCPQDAGSLSGGDQWNPQTKRSLSKLQFMSPSSYLFPNRFQHSMEQPLTRREILESSFNSLQNQKYNRTDSGKTVASTNASSFCSNNTAHHIHAVCGSMTDIGSQPLLFGSPHNNNNNIVLASQQQRYVPLTEGGENGNSGEGAITSEEDNEYEVCASETGSRVVPGRSDCINMNRTLGASPIPGALSAWLPSAASSDDLAFGEHAAENLYSSDTLGSDEYLLHAQHSCFSQSFQLQHDDEQSTKRFISGQLDDLPSAVCRQEDTAQDAMMYEPASSDTQPFSDPPEHHAFEDDDEHRYDH